MAELLLTLYAHSTLSAKDLCLLCHHASRAGVQNESINEWAYCAGDQSGHYSRHLRRKLPRALPSAELNMVSAPVFDKTHRRVRQIPVSPVHEILDADLDDSMDSVPSREHSEWAPSFWDHEEHTVLGDDRPCWPIALYCDGIQYSKQTSVGKAESALGFFVYKLRSQRRISAAVLQKSQLCRCGCRGYCTLSPILSYLEWTLAAASDGVRPAERWDGTPWPETSVYRRLYEKSPRISSRFLVTQIRGDWVEFAGTFSFPSHATFNAPCMFCKCSKETMLNFCGVTSDGHDWGVNEGDWYDQECQRAEVTIHINTEEERQLILSRPVLNSNLDQRPTDRC